MTEQQSFEGLRISRTLLSALTSAGFVHPTPIQQKIIPIGIDGKDCIGIAQTGTGKTLAFGIPLLQRIGRTGDSALIVLPTRELAIQVDEAIQKVGNRLGVRTAVLIGGESMHKQIAQLKRNPHIFIATPGRLIDHLEQRTVNLIDVHILVLDEADRMLDMGFAPQIKRVMQAVPKDRQTMLFSATMPKEIARLAGEFMRTPVQVEVAPSGTAAEKVSHELFIVPKDAKPRLLAKILAETHGTVLVFTRTKYGARKIATTVRRLGHKATELHSNRSLQQRRMSLEGFKRGTFRVLVATDIAARGIDVENIELVLNYDLPTNTEDYVHRIGRTGRAGREGKAISFAMPDQRRDVQDIERLIRSTLPRSPLPHLPELKLTQAEAPAVHTDIVDRGRHATIERPERPVPQQQHPRQGGRPGKRSAPFHADRRVFFGPGLDGASRPQRNFSRHRQRRGNRPSAR